MMYELYIDGSRVDLGDSQITLNYKSGVMNDFNNIIGNTSYSITLPKTSRNMAAFKGLSVITCNWQETNLSARLLQDGIVVIDDAKVYITSISDNIEIILLWGINKTVSVNLSKKLNELDFDWQDHKTYVNWSMGRAQTDVIGTQRYPYVDYGQGLTKIFQPVITLKELVDIIKEKVDIIYPDDVLEDMKNKVIPLLQNKSYEKYEQSAKLTFHESGYFFPKRSDLRGVYWEEGNKIYEAFRMSIYNFPPNEVKEFDPPETFNEFFGTDIMKHSRGSKHFPKSMHQNIELEVHVSGTFSLETVVGQPDINFPKIAVLGANEYNKLTNVGSSGVIDYVSSTIRPDHGYTLTYEIDETFTTSSLPCEMYSDSSSTNYDIGVNIWGLFLEHDPNIEGVTYDMEFEVSPKYSSLSLPSAQRYYFIPNLPPLQVGEFLEAISYIYGLTAEYKDGAIHYGKGINEKDNNQYNDWSKMLYMSRRDAPKDISYTTSGYTRFNKFVLSKYDKIKLDLEYNYEFSIDNSEDDSTTEIDTHISLCGNDGKVLVSRTIEEDKQIHYNWIPTAKIPIYSLSSAEKKENNIFGYFYYYDRRYDFDAYDGLFVLDLEIVEGTTSKYKALQKISIVGMIEQQRSSWLSAMKKYTAITEIFKLPAIALKELDMTIPVFLEQYGSKFMIDEITTMENNLAEVKLIKLN